MENNRKLILNCILKFLLLLEPPSTAPKDLEVLMVNSNVTLCWKSASPEDQRLSHPLTYSIEVSTDNGMSWISHIDGLQGITYTLDMLEYGKPYQFRVKAHNRYGSSDATHPVMFVRGIFKKF